MTFIVHIKTKTLMYGNSFDIRLQTGVEVNFQLKNTFKVDNTVKCKTNFCPAGCWFMNCKVLCIFVNMMKNFHNCVQHMGS